jgi:hypothetical protein
VAAIIVCVLATALALLTFAVFAALIWAGNHQH